MKTKMNVTVELEYDGRKHSPEDALAQISGIAGTLRAGMSKERIVMTIIEKAELDTSDEHIVAIADKRNLAIWWFDEEYAGNNLDPRPTPEEITQVVKDLAGDSGVRERIAEEVFDYINNHKESGL